MNDELERRIHASLDAGDDAEQDPAVAEALRHDPGLRQEIRELAQVDGWLREMVAPALREGFAEDVLAGLDSPLEEAFDPLAPPDLDAADAIFEGRVAPPPTEATRSGEFAVTPPEAAASPAAMGAVPPVESTARAASGSPWPLVAAAAVIVLAVTGSYFGFAGTREELVQSRMPEPATTEVASSEPSPTSERAASAPVGVGAGAVDERFAGTGSVEGAAPAIAGEGGSSAAAPTADIVDRPMGRPLMDPGPPARYLSDRDLRTAFEAAEPDVRRCPGVRDHVVTVRVVVDGRVGRATDVAVLEPAVLEPSECIARAIRDTRFPHFAGTETTRWTYPLPAGATEP